MMFQYGPFLKWQNQNVQFPFWKFIFILLVDMKFSCIQTQKLTTSCHKQCLLKNAVFFLGHFLHSIWCFSNLTEHQFRSVINGWQYETMFFLSTNLSTVEKETFIIEQFFFYFDTLTTPCAEWRIILFSIIVNLFALASRKSPIKKSEGKPRNLIQL